MVRALLAGKKTQTRRVVKPQPSVGVEGRLYDDYWQSQPFGGLILPTIADLIMYCPYGQPGDRLWVREAWHAPLAYDLAPPREIPAGTPVVYRADGAGSLPHFNSGRYRHARFMPRWATRILLEVVAVRVERLQDISAADSISEGICYEVRYGGHCMPDGSHFHTTDPRESYWSLWEAINGPGSVKANPWVWVVEFRRLQ